MDSVQVGKAVFVKEDYTTLGIEPRTYSYPGRSGNPCSVCWVKKGVGWRELETPGPIDRTPEPPGSGKKDGNEDDDGTTLQVIKTNPNANDDVT